MDDGSAHGTGLRLATHCFTEKDVTILMSALKPNFGFIITKHKNDKRFVIYISSKSMNELKALVVPHMCPSMLYKLGAL